MRTLFRRHRVWPWLVAGLLVLAAIAIALVAAGDGGTRQAGGDTTASVPPTPPPGRTGSPSPSPSPPGSAPALVTVTPSPSPAASGSSPSRSAPPPPARSPAPSPASSRPPGDRPDGVPGWDSGIASCRQATAPGASSAPWPGLSVELVLPTNAFRAGHPVAGTIRITNSTATTLGFRTYDAGDDGTLLDRGAPVSAVYSGIRATVEWEVPAGGSSEREVTIETERCADTSGQEGTPLPADRAYRAIVTVQWERPGGSGRWTTAARTVTLFR